MHSYNRQVMHSMSPSTRRLLTNTLILGKPSEGTGNMSEALTALALRTPMHPHTCSACVMVQYVILEDQVGDYYRCAIHGEQVRFGPDIADILKVEEEEEEPETLGYREARNGDIILKSDLVLWPRAGYETKWVESVSRLYPWEDKFGNFLLRALSVLGVFIVIIGVSYLAYIVYSLARLLTAHVG